MNWSDLRLKDDDALAGEFVLGTLERSARFDAQALRADDAAFDKRVRAWEARLQPLVLAIAPVAPSESCGQRIARSIRQHARHRDAGKSDRSDESPVDADDARATRPDLAQRLARWRTVAIAASVMSLTLSAALIVSAIRSGPEAARVPPGSSAASVSPAVVPASDRIALSLLRDGDGTPRYLVEINADSSVRITSLDHDESSDASSLQLWMADDVSGELRPIGLLPRDAWSSVQLAEVPLIERQLAFEVSLEPPGGSPEPGPSGDVVFQGTIHPVVPVR